MKKSSAKVPVKVSFDYETLDERNRRLVFESTKSIKACLRRAAKDIWEIGQSLSKVRACLPYGKFVAWLNAEFEWTPRTAYNFINVFESFRDFEKFSKLDAAASALYLLAAPSTSQKIRDEFIERALSGEKITHKNVQKKIKDAKTKTSNSMEISADGKSKSGFSSQASLKVEGLSPKPEIISLRKKNQLPEKNEETAGKVIADIADIADQSGWYLIHEQHHLFYGDTASAQFSKRVPLHTLAIAITSDDWDHDWLIERGRNVLILEEAAVNETTIEQLLLMLSNPGEIVVFPYLPIPEILAIGHTLKRRLYLGDANLTRCTKVLQQARLPASPLNLRLA